MSWIQAVVVGAVDLGEADRIMRLLTPDRGRLSVVARRVRSSKRRWVGVFDVGNEVRVRTHRSKGSLASVAEAEVVRSPRLARADLERVALLAYGCEICASLAPEEFEAGKLFRLLTTWLEVLEGSDAPKSASRVALEAKALTFAGFSPRLVRCGRCGEPARDPLVFDAEAGGVLHQHCGAGATILAENAALFEGLRRTPLSQTVGRQLPNGARFTLTDFVEYQLARGLRSRSLISELGL